MMVLGWAHEIASNPLSGSGQRHPARPCRIPEILLVALTALTTATPSRCDEPKASFAAQRSPAVIRVWPNVAPGSEDWKQKEIEYRNDWDKKAMVRNVTTPTMTAFLPEPSIATGAAVIVCPGGGFRFLSWESEGTEVAQWLQSHGVAAFVLKYRVMETAATEEEFRKEMAAFFARLARPKDKSPEEVGSKGDASKDLSTPVAASSGVPEEMRKIAVLAVADAKQAIQQIRDRATEWGVQPDRVGVIGFSAGGMVTMGLVMDPETKSRPDFAAPIYGGGTGGQKVASDAPPLFILCATDDHLAAGNSARLYLEWLAAGRPVELHLYEKGGHGFGMRRRGMPIDGWIDRYGEWLGQRGYIKTSPAKP